MKTPNYQGREENISFPAEMRSLQCCLSQPELSPCLSAPQGHHLPSVQFWHLHLGKRREGKALFSDTESIILHMKHESPPQRSAGVS